MRKHLLSQLEAVCRDQLSEKDCQSVLNFARLLAEDSAGPSLRVIPRLSVVFSNAANVDERLPSGTKCAGS